LKRIWGRWRGGTWEYCTMPVTNITVLSDGHLHTSYGYYTDCFFIRYNTCYIVWTESWIRQLVWLFHI
jgi:hypothetical protein